MKLRICEGGRERFAPASLEMVEQVFAPGVPIGDGTEITVADGERWLAAIAVGAEGDAEEFLLSGTLGEADAVSGRAARAEALERFRQFVLASAPA